MAGLGMKISNIMIQDKNIQYKYDRDFKILFAISILIGIVVGIVDYNQRQEDRATTQNLLQEQKKTKNLIVSYYSDSLNKKLGVEEYIAQMAELYNQVTTINERKSEGWAKQTIEIAQENQQKRELLAPIEQNYKVNLQAKWEQLYIKILDKFDERIVDLKNNAEGVSLMEMNKNELIIGFDGKRQLFIVRKAIFPNGNFISISMKQGHIQTGKLSSPLKLNFRDFYTPRQLIIVNGRDGLLAITFDENKFKFTDSDGKTYETDNPLRDEIFIDTLYDAIDKSIRTAYYRNVPATK